jgi:uroporphyrinogen-III synthase
VLVEQPPADPAPLDAAARDLEAYDWVVVASARAVRAITRARGAAWPPEIRTAAVGRATADALVEAGVTRPTLVAPTPGAEALVTLLSDVDWVDRRVLVPTTPGGGRLLADHLRAAWALVDEVEAYVMAPREPHAIAADWTAARPDAAVLASARTAEILADAVGADALRALHAVVAIGQTTAAALERLGVPWIVAPDARFAMAAAAMADALGSGAAR